VLLPLVAALISAVISDVDRAGAVDPGDAETGDVGAGRMVGAYKATSSGYRAFVALPSLDGFPFLERLKRRDRMFTQAISKLWMLAACDDLKRLQYPRELTCLFDSAYS
jgi:hypothetical protein